MLNERIIGTPKTTDVQERSATAPAATLKDNWSLERREWSRVKKEGAASAMRGIRRSLKLLQMRVTARRKKERRGAAAAWYNLFLKTTRGNFLGEMLFRNGAMNCRDGDDDGNGRTDGCLKGPVDNKIYRRTLCSKSFHWPLIGCGSPALLRGRDG